MMRATIAFVDAGTRKCNDVIRKTLGASENEWKLPDIAMVTGLFSDCSVSILHKSTFMQAFAALVDLFPCDRRLCSVPTRLGIRFEKDTHRLEEGCSSLLASLSCEVMGSIIVVLKLC